MRTLVSECIACYDLRLPLASTFLRSCLVPACIRRACACEARLKNACEASSALLDSRVGIPACFAVLCNHHGIFCTDRNIQMLFKIGT